MMQKFEVFQMLWPFKLSSKFVALRPGGKSGFVLVAVVWLAAIIAAIMTGFVTKARIDAISAANVIHAAKTEQIANGLSRLTAWRLATGVPFAADGTSVSCSWRGTHVADIVVQDQAGLIDLNAMPEDFFVGLFKALGKTSDEATEISRTLSDFKDPDSQGQNGGTEPQLYPGMNFGPKNSSFESVEELDQIPGLSDDLYRAVLPLVTVHSAQTGIDPGTAPQNLRLLFRETQRGNFSGSLAPYIGASQGRIYSIDVRVRAENGPMYHRHMIAALLRQPERPYVVLNWERGTFTQVNAIPKSVTPCFN